MAETEVGSLAVKLSLNSADFTKSMASIDRNLKAMGQEMRGMQNHGKAWGNSITGLTTKQEGLTRMLTSQEVKVRQLRDAYERSKAETGENSAATERLAIQLNRATAEYNRTEAELAQVAAALQRQRDELRLSESAWTQLGERMQAVGATMKKVGDSMTKIGKEMSLKVTAPVVAMGTLSAKAAIDFESAFAGIRKTVDATEEEFASLEKGIRDMAKSGPTAATELAAIGESAGQLGIAKENILAFTSTVSDIAVATNMTAEQAATDFARFANITNMPQTEFDKLGSSIVALGNNFATTESEIMGMAMRLAGAGAQVGMSEADILGLSAALTSVGIEAEMGGSAISKVMVNMQVATSTGFTKVQELMKTTGLSVRELQMMASHSGKAFGNLAEDMGMTKKELISLVNAGVDLESFSKIAGMTGEEFKNAFEKDAIGALGAFINGLGNAEEAGESAINMLQEMGITEVRLRDALLRAGNASELFAGAVDLSSNAWTENNALTNEAAQRYTTTASQLETFKNKMVDLGITLGGIIIPALLKVVEAIEPWIEKFSELETSTQKTILVIGGIAAAIGPLLVIGGALVSSIGAIFTAFGTVSAAIAVVTTGVASAVPAVSALAAVFTVLTGPVGIAIAAIAGIAALGLVVYKNWEPIKTFFIDLWKTIGDSGVAVWDSLKVVWQSTVQGFKDLWLSVAVFFSDLWLSISTFGISIWDNLIEKWNAVVSFLTEIFSPMIDFFSELWSTIITTATENFQIFSEVLSIVWSNIQTIAESAWIIIKNVILGPILLLINLVTGDMEEFSKNLSAIWTNISVAAEKIWSTLKESVILVITALIKIGLDLWSKFKATLINLTSSIRETVSGIWERLKTSMVEIISNLVISVFKKWNELKSDLFTLVTNIVKDVLKKWDELKTSTLAKISEVKDNVINPLKEIDLKQIGIDIVQGLINGIKGKIEDVTKAIADVTDAITGKIKDILQIKSPSRLMQEFGEFTGIGLAMGVESTKAANEKAAAGLGKVIATVTQKNAEEVVKIANAAEKKRTAIQQEASKKAVKTASSSEQAIYKIIANAEEKKRSLTEKETRRIAELRRKASDSEIGALDSSTKKLMAINDKAWADIVKKEEKLSKERLDAIKLFIADKKSVEELSLVAEAEIWKKSAELFVEGSKERVAAQAGYRKAMEAIDKERLEAVKQFVADKKSIEQLSIVDEVAIWQKAVDSFKAGTKEKITSQIEYGKALDVVNKEITSVNEKYANEMQKINGEFKRQEEELTKKYETTLNDRMKALYNFAGTFDEFDVKVTKSGAELLKNLGTQVDGFKKWQFEIERLAKRAIDDGLIAELTAMGPKALGELMALNELTDDQLSEYSALYKEKSELARTQAEAELVGMKEDTAKQIGEMKDVATSELSALQTDWDREIKGITGNTSRELNSLKQIGVDAIQGLLDGLNSMHSDLQNTANAIAESVTGTIKDTLQIKSPSRVMRQLGVWITQGLVDGMRTEEDMPSKVIENMASKMEFATRETYQHIDNLTKEHNDELENSAIGHAKSMERINENELKEREYLQSAYGDAYALNSKEFLEAISNLEEKYAEERLKEEEWFLNRKAAVNERYDNYIAVNRESAEQEEFHIMQNYLEKSRKANEISAIEEMRIWKAATESFMEDSWQRSAAMHQLEDAHTRAIEEFEKNNKEFLEQEAKITNEYEKALNDRAKSISSFSGIFDEFVTKSGKSGTDLMKNLQSQVDGFKNWENDITSLSKRAIDEGLLAELKAMGPKAAGELAALNAMTNKQLTEYSKLYQEKSALGRKQAEDELVGLKDDTDKRLEELRKNVKYDLDDINLVWKEYASGVVVDVSEGLSKLEGIGGEVERMLLSGFISTEEGIKESLERQIDEREKANAEMISINRYYADEMKSINDELIENEEKITAEYEKSVESRIKSITSFSGIFDEFEIKVGKTGEQLLGNLKSQVDGFKTWQESISDLSSRAIDEGLLAELEAMGPKAAGELAALNDMTDAQLEEYSKLYQEKQALARIQAEKELIGMKEDTELRIDELRSAANAKLDALKSDWNIRIEEITGATDRELMKLEQIGHNAGQGLLDGLASMEGALVSKAQSIAESVKSAMAGAFDIHSPSRWMRDMIGKNMMVGWMDGMEAMKSKVMSVANASTEWMTPSIPDMSSYSGPLYSGGYGGNGSSTTNNNNRSYTGNTTVNVYAPTASPSEIARKSKQAQRQMAMEWGV